MNKYSFLNAAHTAFFADLYEKYLQHPDSVEPSWRAFFQGFDFGQENLREELIEELLGNQEAFNNNTTTSGVAIPKDIQKEFLVAELIEGYRTRGHLFTKTNPVRDRRVHQPSLAIENFGLSKDDLNTVFDAGNIIATGKTTLAKIIEHLELTYCESIGLEYMYIRDPQERKWIQENIAVSNKNGIFDNKQKKHILRKLTEAVTFENFLHTKYVGQKRFSLEGGESLIPALDAIVERAANHGVKEFVMGMAHRGRLNTLTNIFGKSAKDIFSEFEGKDYSEVVFDGDVKYHIGWTSNRTTDSGKEINMNIAPNPSHLETVGAVVEGIARAKQDTKFPDDFSKVLPIVVHGDAAIAGQGLVYEIIQMSQLDGYKTGGTIHIVVNNQVGFTTNYTDARSSTYCTDIAKVTLAPVLHVNSDDVEAVVKAVNFALDYRMAFGHDVFIDLLGYRRYGHNEGDEPMFTQPKLYKTISGHANPRDIYAEQLKAKGIINDQDVRLLESNYRAELEEVLEDSKKQGKTIITPFMEDEWEGFSPVQEDGMLKNIDTTVSKELLTEVAQGITQLPEGKKYFRKIVRLIKQRREMFFEKNSLDWAMGELLAYGSLIKEGHDVRLSGQDVERGTFSHRHAVIKEETSEEELILLNELGGKGKMRVFNSFLSEYGVLGFDYGYAMARPEALTIWEAQFGDFSNGAQIMIDQYISSGEDKWKTQNGIVMLLPHGYEGQGAEHSSARMERYLQLCAKDNMFVADVTTPANLFHLLRRQIKAKYRKPLVVFTPKSLLRKEEVVSSIEDFTQGSFQPLIKDESITAPTKVKSVVFCTGKFYYDLKDARKELNKDKEVALVRIEQLFPLPTKEMDATLALYKNAKDIVWAQEEPRNMGALGHILLSYDKASSLRMASRRPYGAPSAGSKTRAMRRHQEVIDFVFDAKKDNQKRK